MSKPDPAFAVGPSHSPYPFNRVLAGLPFRPYTCSKCSYYASAIAFDISNRSLPLVRTLGTIDPFSICPPSEGPDHATLLSPTKDSWRSRVTHSIRGRTVTACMLAGVLERNGKLSSRVGTMISETTLLRELYLKYYIEGEGALDDLDLECLVKAPLVLKRVAKLGGVYVSSRSVKLDYGVDVWDKKARQLSLGIQGSRAGFLSADIAQALNARLGSKMFAQNRYLAIPFDLSLSLQDQWERVLPWLDELADYAYRFTKIKRPRVRTNMYRDIYVFLSVRLGGRSVFEVAQEVFPGEKRPSREAKVRKVVANVARVVRGAHVPLPPPVIPARK